MNSINEQWKPVEGYEGLYEISNLGRVKSLNYNRTGVEKVLKPEIHRLVSTAFIPNPLGLPEVNHKDENPSNNVVGNIEWCNRLYNNNFGTRNKRAAASMTNHPALSMTVEASKYPDFSEICLRFPSTSEAGRNGYCSQNVSKCCNGCYCSKGNFYKNLYWRYAS